MARSVAETAGAGDRVPVARAGIRREKHVRGACAKLGEDVVWIVDINDRRDTATGRQVDVQYKVADVINPALVVA